MFTCDHLQLSDLLFGHGVGGEHARADLAAGQIFQAAGHPVRGIELGVQVRFGMGAAVGRRLMERQDVRESGLPTARRI